MFQNKDMRKLIIFSQVKKNTKYKTVQIIVQLCKSKSYMAWNIKEI